MASTYSVTERIEHIDSFNDALPFLKALPLNITKMFLFSSAKHGFFDDLNWDDIIEDDESPTNPIKSTDILHDDDDTKDPIHHDDDQQRDQLSLDSLPMAAIAGPQPSEYAFKMNKSNKRLFSTTHHGTTLIGSFKRNYKYPANDWRNNVKNFRFGTAIFWPFFQRPTKFTVHIQLNKNCVNNAIGFGFIGMRRNQYVMQSRDEYKGHSVMLYGDGQCFASHAFCDGDDPIDCVLDPFVNFFNVGDTVVMEMDLKSDKAVGRIYNLRDADNPKKQFITPLKTANNAIGVTVNVMFKPSLTVLRQIIE